MAANGQIGCPAMIVLPQFDLGEPAGEWTESIVSLVRPRLVIDYNGNNADISSSML